MSTVTGYWRSWGSGHCNAYLNTNFFAEHSTLCVFNEWICSPSRTNYMYYPSMSSMYDNEAMYIHVLGYN